MHRIPIQLHLWLNKRLRNFAGTTNELYLQKLCVYSLCRCCLLVSELDTLHAIDCEYELFMNFKRDLFIQLQQDELKLIEEDLIPLMLLETMFQTKFVPLPEVPSQINVHLENFGRRNLWHGMFPKSFSDWIFKKHREEAWISKYSYICVLTLHQMWIEGCSLCHERNFSRIRIEYQETLQ